MGDSGLRSTPEVGGGTGQRGAGGAGAPGRGSAGIVALTTG